MTIYSVVLTQQQSLMHSKMKNISLILSSYGLLTNISLAVKYI